MGNSSNDTGLKLRPCILFCCSSSSSFLNLIIDGLRFDDKLFSANKFTNASALSCSLGKSLFSNLIGYACNLYPFLFL